MKRLHHYPKEMRDQAVELYKKCENMSQVARELGVSDYTVQRWLHKAGIKNYRFLALEERTTPANQGDINPLLLSMADGNDLTKWQGRDITTMQPREIYAFLKDINIHGQLFVNQKITI